MPQGESQSSRAVYHQGEGTTRPFIPRVNAGAFWSVHCKLSLLIVACASDSGLAAAFAIRWRKGSTCTGSAYRGLVATVRDPSRHAYALAEKIALCRLYLLQPHRPRPGEYHRLFRRRRSFELAREIPHDAF